MIVITSYSDTGISQIWKCVGILLAIIATGTTTPAVQTDCGVRRCQNSDFLDTCRHFELKLNESRDKEEYAEVCSTLEELFKCIARNAFECVMNASNIYEEYEASPWNCTYLTADITIIAQEQLKKSKCSSDGIYEVANGDLNNGDNKVPNSESSQLEDSDADPNDSPHILYSGTSTILLLTTALTIHLCRIIW